ncbi:GcvT family protein [Zavarzinia sp. CC-PAN008]|uniref:GcvT family protein n=1 Tax=Zavarzinia sp. CC-PAN008 TaxID=3243332 RepID=UPI003F742685
MADESIAAAGRVPSHARVVVIGGGIVGCSVAYHLAKSGCTDVVLLEQHQLTAGSTWHAAGAVAQYRSNVNIMALIKYGVDLYQQLEAETGQATGWRPLGGMRLSSNRDRREEYLRTITTARSLGVEMELISPTEALEKFPWMSIDGVDSAVWVPTDGQVSPSDVTMALAKGARLHGAKLVERVRVTGFTTKDGRVTGVETDQGTIACEAVALCGGIWTRGLAARAGVNVPIQPSHHCYIVTDKIPGMPNDTPFMRDPDLWHYFRGEVGALMVGQYEPDPVGWPSASVPDDFEFKLMPENLDHFLPHFEPLLKRIPLLEKAGIRSWFNGLESFTEDQNPVMGEAPELAGFFVCAGFNAYGISAGGGFGMALARWILDGEPPFDLWSADIRRFGALHRSDRVTAERAVMGQGRHYTVHYPFEEVDVVRPLRRSAIYDKLAAAGAQFGEKAGWERAQWFAESAGQRPFHGTWDRPDWFGRVAREHKAAREAVAVFDQSSFAKAVLVGRDAEAVLQRLCSGPMALKPGRATHALMLNARGGIEAELTVARIAPDVFYLVSGTAMAVRDFGHVRRGIQAGEHASLVEMTSAFGVLSVMGPNSRALLQPLAEGDLSAQAMPFRQVAEIPIAGAPVRVMRLTYVGELGFELHVPTEYMATVYEALKARGAAHGLVDGGYRAIDSLRLEKGYRAWGPEIGPDTTPFEAGLDYAVSFKKRVDYVGRAALEGRQDAPRPKRLAMIVAEDASIDLLGRETIYRNGVRVGYLTSGGFGHTLGRPVGMGYVANEGGVDEDFIGSGTWELEVAMRRVPVRASMDPLYDPQGLRARS